MYILGGIIKKTGFMHKVKWYALALIYLFACFATWAEKYIVDYLKVNKIDTAYTSSKLVSYTSVTVVLASVALVVLFSKVKAGKWSTKVISFFAALTFGVYLIHEMPLVRNMFLKNKLVEIASLDAWLMAVIIVAIVISIFLVCAGVEYIRGLLFKALKIKQLLQFIETDTIGRITK